MTPEEILELADNGVTQARLISFLLYAHGLGVEKDPGKALEYLQKALVTRDPFAQYCAGSHFASLSEDKQNAITAFEWYMRAAVQEFAPAQHLVAGCYQYGLGTDVDPEKALEWGLKAARAAFCPAQLAVAFMYAEGIGTSRNLSESFRWYMEAAKNGNADGACHVAGMYEQGEGVPVDEQSALNWYRRAAELGSWMAHSALASIYRMGRLGVTPDADQALKHEQSAEALKTRLAKLREFQS